MLASDEDSGTLDAFKFSLASDIVELVVLTGDDAFLQTMRDAVGSARRLWHVPSGDKVSDLLVAGEVGIVMIDVQALIGPSTEFVAQIQRQFPDLVIVVAGNRDDETALASLISAGVVYRFIHKPLSPARARLFAEAAVRKYGEHRRRTAQLPLRPQATRPQRGGLVGLAILAVAALVLAVWVWRYGPGKDTAHAPAIPAVTTSADSDLLARAALAMAANRLTEPSGDNALELYLQAQARYPADPQARAGLSEVHERLLARAENALLEERLDEAAKAIETARRAGVESGRIAFLSAQLAKSREQLKAAQAQLRVKNEPRAAEERSPPVSSLPDTAPETVKPVEKLADVAIRTDLETQQNLLRKALERLQQDHLIEPADDSARYYLLALRSLDGANPELPAALQDLGGRLLGKSKRALSQDQLTAAHSWLEEAVSIGYASAELTALQQQIETATARQRFLTNIIPSAQLTLLKTVQPIYPNKAATSKLQGWVELDFTVGESGEVRDLVVHADSVPGIFDDAALKAVAQWRYQAVLQDGQPVPARTRVRIRFAEP